MNYCVDINSWVYSDLPMIYNWKLKDDMQRVEGIECIR